MAVEIDTTSIQTGTATASINVSMTVANNANRLLLVMIAAADGTTAPTITSATWGADSLTEIVDTDAAAVWYRVGLYRLIAPAAETRTLTVNFSANSNEVSFVALSLYNVDQATPLLTAQTGVSTAGVTSAWIGCGSVTDGLSAAYILGDEASITPVDSIPEYISVGTATSSAGATSISPTGAPATLVLGDWEYCSVATENNETITPSGSGWAQLGSTVTQDATWQQAVYRRRYDGSNVNPTFSWTSSVGCSARRWAIRDSGSTTPGFHTNNPSTGATHSITGQNSTANNSRAMYLSHAEANTALAADADYTENFDAGSATGPYRLVVGGRDQATSGAGAANFSATGANASWVMRLIETMAASTQTQRQEVQNFGADVCSVNLCTEVSDSTYSQLGWTQPSAGFIAVAVGVQPAASDVLMAQIWM